MLLPTPTKSDVKLSPLLVIDISAGTQAASDPFHTAETPATANGALPLPAGDTDPTRKAALKGRRSLHWPTHPHGLLMESVRSL
jgi:hypothetical protein